MFIVLQVSLRKVVTHMVMLHVMVLFSVDTQISRNKLLKSEEFSLDEKRVRFYFTHLFCYQLSKDTETGTAVIAALIEKKIWKRFVRWYYWSLEILYSIIASLFQSILWIRCYLKETLPITFLFILTYITLCVFPPYSSYW